MLHSRWLWIEAWYPIKDNSYAAPQCSGLHLFTIPTPALANLSYFIFLSQLLISFSRRSYSWSQVTLSGQPLSFANIHSRLLQVFSWPGSSFLCISELDVIIVPLMKNISVAIMTKASTNISVQGFCVNISFQLLWVKNRRMQSWNLTL